MHTGHRCELGYGDLLLEASLVANDETDIHRYNYLNAFIGSLGYNYKVLSMWKAVLLY